MYILDRFEENYAVIEHTDKYGEISMIKTAKNTISSEVKEGDVLCFENGIYITDEKSTEKRRSKINNQLGSTDKKKKVGVLEVFRIYVVINCVYLLLTNVIVTISLWFNLIHFIEICSIVSLIVYVFYGICAIHIILDIVLLFCSIYNRVKWQVKKGFIFTLIITFISIILNIYGNNLAYFYVRIT